MKALKHEQTSFCPISPAPNPVDYAVWGILQHHVHRNQIKDVEERRSTSRRVGRLDQWVINNAIRKWHKRLRACIAAEWGHSKHALWTWLLCFVRALIQHTCLII